MSIDEKFKVKLGKHVLMPGGCTVLAQEELREGLIKNKYVAYGAGIVSDVSKIGIYWAMFELGTIMHKMCTYIANS